MKILESNTINYLKRNISAIGLIGAIMSIILPYIVNYFNIAIVKESDRVSAVVIAILIYIACDYSGSRLYDKEIIKKDTEFLKDLDKATLNMVNKIEETIKSKFECHAFNTRKEAFNYIIEKLQNGNIKDVYDTHLVYGNRYPYNDNDIKNLQEAIKKFLKKNQDSSYTEIINSSGCKIVDEIQKWNKTEGDVYKYNSYILRSDTQFINFTIIIYENGDSEVYFGWGYHIYTKMANVFIIKNNIVTEYFINYFNSLKNLSTQYIHTNKKDNNEVIKDTIKDNLSKIINPHDMAIGLFNAINSNKVRESYCRDLDWDVSITDFDSEYFQMEICINYEKLITEDTLSFSCINTKNDSYSQEREKWDTQYEFVWSFLPVAKDRDIREANFELKYLSINGKNIILQSPINKIADDGETQIISIQTENLRNKLQNIINRDKEEYQIKFKFSVRQSKSYKSYYASVTCPTHNFNIVTKFVNYPIRDIMCIPFISSEDSKKPINIATQDINSIRYNAKGWILLESGFCFIWKD